MRIELNLEQERALRAWAEENSSAEAAADCEPAGYSLRLDISPYGCKIEAQWGTRILSLGSPHVVWDLPPDDEDRQARLALTGPETGTGADGAP